MANTEHDIKYKSKYNPIGKENMISGHELSFNISCI